MSMSSVIRTVGHLRLISALDVHPESVPGESMSPWLPTIKAPRQPDIVPTCQRYLSGPAPPPAPLDGGNGGVL
jgi:hypothetical protein